MFKKKIADYNKEDKPLIYVDESGFALDMPRTHGYSNKGKRCYGSHNWNAKGRMNVLGAMNGSELIACGICEYNIDTDVFNTWVENILIPDLPKNSVIIMDNASFHKSQKTKELIQNNGHVLEYLPPYSPDLNPIEHKWAQAKAVRRKHDCDIYELFQKYIV